MRLVRQAELGCGIACMAMLTGYSRSKIRLLTEPFPPNLRTLKKVLQKFNLVVSSPRYYYQWNNYRKWTSNAILVFDNKDGSCHAVVWNAEEKRIFDPITWNSYKYSKHPLAYVLVKKKLYK